MAPRVVSKSTAPEQDAPLGEVPASDASVPIVKTPDREVENAIAALRKKVEETSDYVGEDFTRQAREMHLGDVPERAIYGEANLEQARGLIEDGVPLLPLPFRPRQKLS